jgi:hypothetical protein
MNKRGKPSSGEFKASPKAQNDGPAETVLVKDPRRPEREPAGNLRQRAEWFRRRTGGAEEK